MAVVSLSVVAMISSLHLIAFVFTIGAEMRRSTGKVVPDEYDERTYCAYDSDASTLYGLAAFGLLLLSHAVLNVATRCLCFGRGLTGAGGGSSSPRRSCVVCFFVLSWVSLVVGAACLVAGSARNAYHTKYLGYYAKHDLASCAALRKGVFAAAAAMELLSLAASLAYYWAHAKADTGGWQKHRNEGGVGMTDYNTQRDDFVNVRV